MAGSDADDAAKDVTGEPAPEDTQPEDTQPEDTRHGDTEPGQGDARPEDTKPEETTDPKAAEEGAPPKPVRRRRRALKWAAAVVAVVVLASGGTAVYLYERLNGNIHKEHVEDQLGPNRPAKLNKSMNILLLGSDSREGENKAYWSPDISGERSDTTILLHISPNRDHAVAVSFPRDSMVQVPGCTKKNGGKVAPYFGMLNSAFAYAGASCTWKTIESTTNIHIDHYVKIDFTGFKRVVDALGGVEICVPHAVYDPRADLSLRAGRQVVKGNAALGYVRTRYGLGDGSDLERIQRQQKFMASVVNKATSGSMLTDPARIYKFLDAVTKSIATDDELSVSAMRKLAMSLRGMTAGTVKFVTVPTRVYPRDPNRVQWDMAQARPLFDAIRRDDALPAPEPSPPQEAPPKPEEIKVRVVNPPKGVVKDLRSRRYQVTSARGPVPKETEIRYGPGAERQADALGTIVPGIRIVPDPAVPAGTVSLVVSPAGVRLTPVIPAVDGEIKADQNLCR